MERVFSKVAQRVGIIKNFRGIIYLSRMEAESWAYDNVASNYRFAFLGDCLFSQILLYRYVLLFAHEQKKKLNVLLKTTAKYNVLRKVTVSDGFN